MLIRRALGCLVLFLMTFTSTLSMTAAHAGTPKDAQGERNFLVHIGTYTGGKSQGIYVCRFDASTGALGEPELAAAIQSPSFLALGPQGRFLYAVNEIGNFAGTSSGAVSAFSVDSRTGKLTLLNQVSSGGNGPCHVVVDPGGKCAVVANYGGGSVEVVPILNDGRVGDPSAFIQHRGTSINPRRQEGPHAHCVALDRTGRLAYVADLGLDEVLIYRLDASKGLLTPNVPAAGRLKPGSGPRHLVFDATGKFAYVINELSSSITVFACDPSSGAMREVQSISTRPTDAVTENSTAEVLLHPSGKFVYGSNRGDNNVAVFSRDAKTGKLTSVQYVSTQGKTPRNIALDPTGNFLLAANQDSDSVVVFRVDPSTGHLAQAGQPVTVGRPVCLTFMPEKR